ncbi:MAG: hypothetical protein E6Q83_03620 [Thiothrix sp.]|nr:MAG: hypothetical protein E6Q83_03620 [Thiothrix sp.]
MERIDTGDTVFHRPSQETWTVCYADYETGRICPAGWPETIADIADCDFIKKGSSEYREELLQSMSKLNANDSRKRYAERVLGNVN